jgi:F0F1-type ATP synthase delta subunit
MIYSPQHYAEALYEALEGKEGSKRAEVLKRFSEMLEKNHQQHLVTSILVRYEKVFLQRNNLRKVDIESASPLEDNVRKDIENILGGDILLTEEVNKQLVAGLTILIDDDVYIDASARTQINNLF